RRHTRSKRDWSSDVCSSDLGVRGKGGYRLQLQAAHGAAQGVEERRSRRAAGARRTAVTGGALGEAAPRRGDPVHGMDGGQQAARSEERRVGKESRSWWTRER